MTKLKRRIELSLALGFCLILMACLWVLSWFVQVADNLTGGQRRTTMGRYTHRPGFFADAVQYITSVGCLFGAVLGILAVMVLCTMTLIGE